MGNVTVERLDVTITVDDDEGDTAFAAHFEKYMRRWREREREMQLDHQYAERDRLLPDGWRGGRP
jgi:hypothetical protein